MRGPRGKSAAKSHTASHLTGLLVLRGSRGKSACFPCPINDLPRLLVLHGDEQDSTEMAEEIGAGNPEFFLGEIPRQLREGWREHQRQQSGLGLVGLQPAALDAMRDEVVGITPTPRGLCLGAPRDLTRRGRTGMLATSDTPVGREPMAADAAGPLREHPQMLASSVGNQGGPLLASNPGSILASAEVGQHRRAKTLLQFFRWFGTERTAALAFICSDMWKPYVKVVAKKAGHALHILDRFHIAQHLSEAIDHVRRAEVRSLRLRGRQPVLTKARWLLLKRREHQTREQRVRLRELVRHNVRAVRAMLFREWFDHFWHYRSLEWAGAFLDEWCAQVMRSRLEPMKKVARMLRRHRPLLLNWFRARGEISAAIVEGFNNKAKLTTRKAYGFRSYRCLEIALYHTLGQLPEPEATHRFC